MSTRSIGLSKIRSATAMLATLFLSGPVLAQSLATLTGTVVDPSGSVVPGAQVVCRNTSTGLTHTAQTSAEGLFRFPDLPIGRYELVVSHPGFERLVRAGLQLLTGSSVDVALELRVGQTTQSLEVTSAAPVIQRTTSALQTSFDARNTRELPLNGRNPLQLVVLTPGARISNVGTLGDQEENPGVATNGLRTIDNNFQLDGVSYVNRQWDTPPLLPAPDSLEEFTVKSSNYSASDSGAGAMVQLATRSGSNELHGSAYEFVRNDALDARNFFSTAVTAFKRNQFGATLGGPLVKDKTFLFGSYQGTRVSGGASPTRAVVPTAEMRRGDFSSLPKTIIDPSSGRPFTNNNIPDGLRDSLAIKLLQFVPLPNLPNGQVTQTPNTNINDNQFIVRFDHNFTSRDHFAARYSFDEYDYNRLTSPFPNIFARNFYRDQNLLLSDTHLFGPRLLFTGSFGYTRVARTQIPTEPVTLQALGQKVPEAIDGAAPELRVNVIGYFNLFSGGGIGSAARVFQYRGRFSWARGKHLLQFGGDVERDLLFSTDTSFASGDNTFNGSRTSSSAFRGSGDSFADFLLGLPSRFFQGGRTPQDLYETKWQPWIQDDWKVLPRLTLNLGLRWEPWLPPNDRLGPTAGFVAGARSLVAPDAPAGMVFSGDPGLRDSIYATNWNNLAPRLGFAWDVSGNGRTVIRSAYGLFYRTTPLNIERVSNSGSAFRSLSTDLQNPPSFQDPYTDFPGGDPFPFTPRPVSALKTYRFVRPVVTSLLDPASRTGYTQQWNLTVERQLRSGLGVSASYVGNHSIRIMAAYQANPAVYGPGATAANTDARRVYLGFGPLGVTSPWEFGNYHSLQLQTVKRAAQGLSLVANYVYSRCMDDASAQVQGADAGGGSQIHKFNLHADYAPCDFDVTHASNISLIYDLPRFRSLPSAASHLLNGWKWTTIVAVRSGLPFTVFSGRDNSLSGIPFNDLADQRDSNSGRPAGADSLQRWFNTAIFVDNAAGTFGTAQRNSLRGPGAWNFDIGLLKDTPLGERAQLQFRFEGFNVLNRANLNNPVSTAPSNANFGKILGAGDPRVLQFALKLAF